MSHDHVTISYYRERARKQRLEFYWHVTLALAILALFLWCGANPGS